MKKLFYLTSLLVCFAGFAQIPAGYYNSATGTGYTLKTQLHNIIKTNNNSSSNNYSYNKLRDLYSTTYSYNGFRDRYYENDNTLLDIYSENPNGLDPYNYNPNTNRCGDYSVEGDCHNREHLIPQSYFSSNYPMYSDAFHVWPTDGKVNGLRDNYAFGVVGSNATTTLNGSKRGSNLNSGYSQGYSGIVFEPIDEFKGDIARAFFYFATRYENQMTGFYNNAPNNIGSKAMFDGTSNKVFSQTFLNILYQWHIQDPVSQRETDINNLIYYNFQGNRNPFIDHPEYVTDIWGAFASVNDIEPIYVAVYPNPSRDNKINITTDKEIEEITLININGQIIQKVSKPNTYNDTYTIENLPQGFYILNLNIDNQSITKKVIIN